MSKNNKTRNQVCTEVSLDTWKFTSGWNMINTHERLLHRKCRICDYKNRVRLSLYCTYTKMKSSLGRICASGWT